MKNLRLTLRLLFIGASLTLLSSCTSNKEKSTDDTAADSVAAATPPPTAPVSARPVHWGYSGEDGPANWESLSPVYALCGEGKGQSPINIEKGSVQGNANWTFDYKNTSLHIAHNEHMDDILDNGHTIQVTVDEGSTFIFAGKSYSLKQFHFHTPSEHQIDGKNLPMEMHMVHQSEDKSLAVVSILFEEGKVANENIAQIVANLPSTKGETNHVEGMSLDLQAHLPKDNQAYHYVGSLTTPPCSESVQWLVLRNTAKVTKDQVDAIAAKIGPNNRPVQGLNGRSIEQGDLTGQVSN